MFIEQALLHFDDNQIRKSNYLKVNSSQKYIHGLNNVIFELKKHTKLSLFHSFSTLYVLAKEIENIETYKSII